MTDERWEQVKENLKRRFEIIDERADDLLVDTPEGRQKQGTRDIIVARTPIGKIKLVREIRPLLLEKKFHYTHRQGATAQAHYTFSDTEKTDKLRLFKWNDIEDDWREIDPRDTEGLL